MVTRTRIANETSVTGTRTRSSGSVLSYTRSTGEDHIIDEIKVGDGGTLSIDKWKKTGAVVNGVSGINTVYSNFPATHIFGRGSWYMAQNKPYGDSTNAVYATKLLRMTNPSRPTVDIPVFIAELKDFPQLFKIVGDTALKTLAKSNLSFWFGWKPLASDLLKLMDFARHTHNRYNELLRLYNGGLSRTVTLDTLSYSENRTLLYGIYDGNYWYSNEALTSSLTIRGHVKWKPTTLPPKTDAEYIALARRAALGLTIDPATFWELIPFSWLVDWFSNVGDFLMYKRNIVPAVAYDTCIMRHYTHSTTGSGFSSGGLIGEPMTHKSDSKNRASASASLSADLQWLSARQMSILGSLYVLKDAQYGGLRRRL